MRMRICPWEWFTLGKGKFIGKPNLGNARKNFFSYMRCSLRLGQNNPKRLCSNVLCEAQWHGRATGSEEIWGTCPLYLNAGFSHFVSSVSSSSVHPCLKHTYMYVYIHTRTHFSKFFKFGSILPAYISIYHFHFSLWFSLQHGGRSCANARTAFTEKFGLRRKF